MYLHPLRKAVFDKLDRIAQHLHAHYGHLPEHRDRVSGGDYTAVLYLYGRKEQVWDCPMVELLPYRDALNCPHGNRKPRCAECQRISELTSLGKAAR